MLFRKGPVERRWLHFHPFYIIFSFISDFPGVTISTPHGTRSTQFRFHGEVFLQILITGWICQSLMEKVARGLCNRSPWPFISNFPVTYHKSCGAVCSCNHSLHSKGNKSELNHQGDGCHHLTVPLCAVLSFTILIFVHLPLNSMRTPWITSSLSSLLVSHAAQTWKDRIWLGRLRINDESTSRTCENDGDVDGDMGQVASPASPFPKTLKPIREGRVSQQRRKWGKAFPSSQSKWQHISPVW